MKLSFELTGLGFNESLIVKKTEKYNVMKSIFLNFIVLGVGLNIIEAVDLFMKDYLLFLVIALSIVLN